MDELQSMGLTAEVEYIPIDTSKVPYTFSIKLYDRTYTLTVGITSRESFSQLTWQLWPREKCCATGIRCGTGDQCFG